MNARSFTIGEWHYNDETKSLLNTRHGTWELELRQATNASDLLFWIMQAGQKQFNMTEFLQAIGRAAQLHFDTGESNPVISLKVLYDIEMSRASRREVDWQKAEFRDRK